MEEKDLWVNKYAPKTLDDIVGQKELVAAFKAYVKNGFIPNLILAGDPGVGKTLIIECFARDLGIFEDSGRFIKLNASDDRGIDMVRSRLKQIAEANSITQQIKLIFMDEGDGITTDAQEAMRGLIEKYAGKARFILTGNYSQEFISAINSRCPMKVVKPLTKEDITEMIKRIQAKENFQIDQESIDILYKETKGDLRQLIGKLQDAALLSQGNITKVFISQSTVAIDTALTILNTVASNRYEEAKELLQVTQASTKNNKALTEALYFAADKIKFSPDSQVDHLRRMKFQEYVATIDYRLTQGTNPIVQLNSILAYFQLVVHLPTGCTKAMVT